MVRWMRGALVVITLLAGTLVVAGSPASADTASCFYTMTIKSGTKEIRADWNLDGHTDHCFAIAPDRTIWTVWSGSNGWKLMPNNGRADSTCIDGWGRDPITNLPTVYVWVNGKGVYSSSYDTSTHRWLAWYHEFGYAWC